MCLFLYVVWIILRDAAMASITERAQRMEKDLRETTAKHDRTAAELQVKWANVCADVQQSNYFHHKNIALPWPTMFDRF